MGVGAFVIGLSQISSFLSVLQKRHGSHPSVHDLKSMTRLAESWMSQIIDTRMGFPCPFRSIVIIFLPRLINPVLMLF